MAGGILLASLVACAPNPAEPAESAKSGPAGASGDSAEASGVTGPGKTSHSAVRGSGTGPGSSKRPSTKTPLEAALLATVERLAGPGTKGRATGTEESRAVAAWIAQRFESLGFEPVVDGGYYHDFRAGRAIEGRNVAGILRASSPDALDEYVVVGAHYDHHGIVARKVWPGADDNASGVAGLLQLAEHFASRREELRRHLVFVSYDLEEKGLIGSRHFVAKEIIPSAKTRFMCVFDLIGGTLMPGQEATFYALGSEHSAELRELLVRLEDAKPQGAPYRCSPLGTYLIEPVGEMMARSDYAPYRSKKIPYLFFTTATPWYYHTPFDTPDRLDYAKMAAIVTRARDVLTPIVQAKTTPRFVRRVRPERSELAELQRMLAGILERADEWKIEERSRDRVAVLAKRLARLASEEGEIKARGRRWMQHAVIAILNVARALAPPGTTRRK